MADVCVIALQMLAAGSCQDGNLCGAGFQACNQATISKVGQGYEASSRNKYFSTAYLQFGTGRHTVLLRHNNYMACGAGSSQDCVGGGGLGFKVETGG